MTTLTVLVLVFYILEWMYDVNLKFFIYFQMKDLEDRRNDAEQRAETAEDKVS